MIVDSEEVHMSSRFAATFILSALLIFLLFPTPDARAEFKSLGDITQCREGRGYVEFTMPSALLRITVLDNDLIRIRYTREKSFADKHSYALIEQSAGSPSYTVKDNGDSFLLTTPALQIIISKKPCRITIYDKAKNLLMEDEKSFGVMVDGEEMRAFKRLLPDEQFLGLGEKTGYLDRRGEQYVMWNSDYPFYGKEQDPLYASIPFFIGLRENRAYGIFLDNTFRSTFSMGAGSNRFYWFGADKGDLDYYFIYGPSMKRVITDYTALTGRMGMPPRWALGFQQSRWSYPSETKVREIAKGFRERHIPCDVIYLDIDYMNGYRVFTWNKERFPDPEGMLSSLSRDGFKIVPIIDPGVKADPAYFAAKEGIEGNFFVKYPDGVLYQGQVWPSWAYFPDFTNEKTRLWWGEKVSSLLEVGVAGIWNDMNEPAVWGRNMPDIVQFDGYGRKSELREVRNIFALEMAKATHDAMHKYSKKRHFVLTRAGFAGIQRYAAMWTGDNVANEDHLLLACLMPQSMGICGLPFVGSDVGGFGGMPSPELYVRWMQLGAFTPFFRAHSCIDAPAKEPWALGAVAEKLNREAVEMRYRFLPFIYTEFHAATQTGLPIMRPLALNFQEDPECLTRDAQKEFMIGDSLLVAPVLSEKETKKKLYLPAGRWMSLWNADKIQEGKKWITVDAPLSQIPVFVKEGGIIPLQDVQQYVGEKPVKELSFEIFPGASSSYDLYEDDGESYNFEKGEYALTKIEVRRGDKEMRVNIARTHEGYESGVQEYAFRIYDTKAPGTVMVNGKALAKVNEKGIEGYGYDIGKRAVTVRVKAKMPMEIKITQ
jgi:alpha-glucosidase